jgi:NTP pyrophosphatase (non-canonical NTP hydrolase)
VEINNDIIAILLEELGECQQIIGKILRHGLESRHPNGGPANRELLQSELGDVSFAMRLLCDAGDLDAQEIEAAVAAKKQRVKQYLHHQSDRNTQHRKGQ